MQSFRAVVAGIIGLSFSAIGCGSEPLIGNQSHVAADEASDEEPTATSESEIIVMNGSDPRFFWEPATQKALQKLAKTSLEVSLRDSAPEPLLDSEEGRALLEHVVACALPAGETILAADGAPLEGTAGLAAHWKSQPLGDRDASRWVTACLLQTLNGFGAQVPIRLTGGHPELGGDASGESSAFTVEDATMFGDIFVSDEPAAFACADNALEDMCDLSLSEYTLFRLCGHSPTCGVRFLGLCSSRCSHGEAGALTCETPDGDAYPEAISSYLKETASLSLGEGCSFESN
jgi:hypothetical protein